MLYPGMSGATPSPTATGAPSATVGPADPGGRSRLTVASAAAGGPDSASPADALHRGQMTRVPPVGGSAGQTYPHRHDRGLAIGVPFRGPGAGAIGTGVTIGTG